MHLSQYGDKRKQTIVCSLKVYTFFSIQKDLIPAFSLMKDYLSIRFDIYQLMKFDNRF